MHLLLTNNSSTPSICIVYNLPKWLQKKLSMSYGKPCFINIEYDRITIDKPAKYNIENRNHIQYSNILAVPETQVPYRDYSLSVDCK